MRTLLAFLVLLASNALADITLDPPVPQPYQKVAAAVDWPVADDEEEDDQLLIKSDWTLSNDGERVPIKPGDKAYLWLRPGITEIKCRVNRCEIIDGKLHLTWEDHTRTVAVGVPSPPEPTPQPESLCDLLTPSQAATLQAIYAEQADVVANLGGGTTTGQFWDAHDESLVAVGLLDNPACKEIEKRIFQSIGAVDVPLEGKVQTALVACLTQIAEELKCSPEPEPQPEPPAMGPRIVIVVRESTNPPQSVVRTLNDLIDGTARQHLDSHEHTLYIVDPDQTTTDGRPHFALRWVGAKAIDPPAVYVLDPQTKAVLGASRLPKTSQGVIDFLKKYGG